MGLWGQSGMACGGMWWGSVSVWWNMLWLCDCVVACDVTMWLCGYMLVACLCGGMQCNYVAVWLHVSGMVV